MDNQGISHVGDEIEEFPEEFTCCVCLDLFYKPVVLGCGHIACFWCVFEAMDALLESRCPICRRPYNHFPSICRPLHFLLRKFYPSAYEKREKQMIEEEKINGTFSAHVEDYSSESRSRESQQALVSDSSEVSPEKDNATFPTSLGHETTINPRIHESSKCQSSVVDSHFEQEIMTYLCCSTCKQLLYRPVVLNCGHVFCEDCIINSSDKLCRCPECKSMHPNGFPKVCLVLEHFLEEHASEEYAARREVVRKFGNNQNGSASMCSTQAQEPETKCSSPPSNDHSPSEGRKVHFGVGCDCCGMYPIIGECYKCKNCKEEIGFDLCEGCYKGLSKHPGRFNQQHTSDHEFEIREPHWVSTNLFAAEYLQEYGVPNLEDLMNIFRAPNSQMDPGLELGQDLPISTNGRLENREESDGNS